MPLFRKLLGWMLLRASLTVASLAVLLAGGPTFAAAQATAGSAIASPELTRTDLNFSISVPSEEWKWDVAQPQGDLWAFRATHQATRSQAVLSVAPLRHAFDRSLADAIVAGIVESIVRGQPGFAEAGRSVSPSSVPRAGSFRVETSLRNEAQGTTIRVWGYVFAGERVFSLFVLSTHDSGAQAIESLIGSFRFLREPSNASPAPTAGLSGATGPGATARPNPAGSVGVFFLLLVLLLASLGWLVNKAAGRPMWDGARTALLLLLIALVVQVGAAVTDEGPDVGRAVGGAVGTLLIPLAVAAWLSKRFQRAKAAKVPRAVP